MNRRKFLMFGTGIVLESIINSGCEKSEHLKRKKTYLDQDFREITNIVYAEAANQSPKARKGVARVILNRVKSQKYPNNIHNVIFQKNAFSCIGRNKNWREVTGQEQMNDYEKRVYEKCKQDVSYILNNGKIKIPDENEIIAYHDERIQKPKSRYWNSLKKVIKIDNLTFYKD